MPEHMLVSETDQHVEVIGDAGRRRRLENTAFAGPAAVFWTAGDNHPELGRDHVEPFGDVFTDDVHLCLTRRITARSALRCAGRAVRSRADLSRCGG